MKKQIDRVADAADLPRHVDAPRRALRVLSRTDDRRFVALFEQLVDVHFEDAVGVMNEWLRAEGRE
jgi:hypothetical protein